MTSTEPLQGREKLVCGSEKSLPDNGAGRRPSRSFHTAMVTKYFEHVVRDVSHFVDSHASVCLLSIDPNPLHFPFRVRFARSFPERLLRHKPP